MDDILGPIPRQEELLTEIKTIEDEIKAESDESSSLVSPFAKSSKAGLPPDLPPADTIAPPPASRPPPPGAPTSPGTADTSGTATTAGPSPEGGRTPVRRRPSPDSTTGQ